MPRATLYKPSGNAGEISPRLHARTDFTKYGAAWALCENMIPLAEGAMTRRPGTRYVHALADQTKRGRLMRFEFSDTQAYPLVFEEEAIYFNRNQGQILVADTDAAISNGTFDTDLTDWDDVSTGSAEIAHEFADGNSVDTLQFAQNATRDWGDAAAANRKHYGLKFTAPASGIVTSASIAIAAVTAAITAQAAIYSDNAGSPGTIVGSASDTLVISTTGTKTLIFSTPPSITEDTVYWVVLSDTLTTGNVLISCCADQGSAFATGRHDTITSITDGSGSLTGDVRVKLEIASPGANGLLALVGDGSDVAAAEQDVTTTDTGQEHVLAFRVIGAPGDKIKVRIGRTSLGDQFLEDMEVSVGWHVVAFTPDASPFYVGFRNEANKTIYIDDVSLLDNQHLCLTTPYAEADLQSLYPVQSADVMYLFHQDYPTYKLLRYGHTSWSLERVAWEDGPYLTENTDSEKTLEPSATTGNGITISASGHSPFTADDVGRAIRLRPSGEPGWAVITEFVSPEQVKADVKRDFAANTATANWRFGAWSDGTGWPRCGVFFEQRLFLGGASDRSQSFGASQTSDFENMRPDSYVENDVAVQDDDALDYTISSNQIDAILSMTASADDMFILTSGGVWRPTSNGASMTPTDITVKRQVSSAVASILPLTIDNIVLFVQRGLRKIRELGFSFEADGYRAIDMTRLAQHMTVGKVHEIAFAEEPESQVFALLENGKLPAMTFRREEDVVGWGRHILGGSFSSGHAVVESIVTIPGNNGAGQTHDSTERDEVWMIVKRTIDGSTVRYVEFLEREHDADQHDLEDAFYVDCGLTYDGSSTSTITGLDHLEGETVKVWADGDLHDDKTVASGQITLDAPASVVQVGLGYTHKLRTLKAEGGAAAGTAVTKIKRNVKMGIVLLNSRRVKFGHTAADLTTVDLSDELDFADGLFTGEIVRDWPEGWKRDPRVYFEDDAPAPFTLLAVAPESDTKDYV